MISMQLFVNQTIGTQYNLCGECQEMLRCRQHNKYARQPICHLNAAAPPSRRGIPLCTGLIILHQRSHVRQLEHKENSAHLSSSIDMSYTIANY